MTGEKFEEAINRQRREIDVSGAIFRTRIFRVSELIEMLDAGKLRMVGGKPFKRWLRSIKSRVIEGLLMGLPPGSIIIDGSDISWYIVDGAELIAAISEYVKDVYALGSVNFEVGEYAGATFSKLPLMLQSRLTNLEIIATVINPDTRPIYRLGIYNSSLLKIDKERKLWNCMEAVYPVIFKKIQSEADILGINDPHIMWRIMTAMLFDGRFKTGKFDDDYELGDIRYDMFECILLERFDVILKVIMQIQPENYAVIRDIAKLTEEAFDSDIILWTEKKRTIFTIVLTLLIDRFSEIDLKRFLQRFKTAWKKNLDIGNGYLYRNYAKKSSVIYSYLSK